jgi:hypothetical protein
MFTQQAPALVRALRDVLTPEQLDRVTQSLGNCQQTLAHRGPVNLSPPAGIGRNQRGVYGPGAWDPARYPGLIPNAGNFGFYEIGGMDPPVWNSGNKYASAFNFPTDQYFQQNQFFGGPQVYISQNASIENITNQSFDGDTITANSITVNEFNGQDLPPAAGPAGSPGAQGRPGAPGEAGEVGVIPVGAFRPIRYLTGQRPSVNVTPKFIPPRVTDVWVRRAVTAVVPTAVTFDQENCAISFSATTTVWTVAQSTAASTLLSALVQASNPLPPVTIAGAAYGNAAPITAKLRDVRAENARVFQQ